MEATLRSDDETMTRPADAAVVRGDAPHNPALGKEIVVDRAENRFEHRTRIAKRVVVAEARNLQATPFQEADAYHIDVHGVASRRARSFVEVAGAAHSVRRSRGTAVATAPMSAAFVESALPVRVTSRWDSLVPKARIELALCCQNRILSPARLPVPPLRHGGRRAASSGTAPGRGLYDNRQDYPRCLSALVGAGFSRDAPGFGLGRR